MTRENGKGEKSQVPLLPCFAAIFFYFVSFFFSSQSSQRLSVVVCRSLSHGVARSFHYGYVKPGGVRFLMSASPNYPRLKPALLCHRRDIPVIWGCLGTNISGWGAVACGMERRVGVGTRGEERKKLEQVHLIRGW
ncbi:hypothetical protein COCNU_01G003980 [Cocos nucifera]|uniref:Uncharacterized protein n=1 Tax=Cocos nucifera TaxID=13894 RepID=A0A8K0HUN3_COCNU|nr:hypothetical protein COCNU_01G003980 [Cocos nucifera]